MVGFLSKCRVANFNNTIIITVPKDIVSCYDINPGDYIEMEFRKNHRDGKK